MWEGNIKMDLQRISSSTRLFWLRVGKVAWCCEDGNEQSSCLYRASMTIKTLYYPTDAQIYNL